MWHNVPGITPERVESAWLGTYTIDPGPMWPWLNRKIQARRIRKADRNASEPNGPQPTLPDPGRHERR